MKARNTLLGAPPYEVEAALKKLGADLRTARLRRNLTSEEAAQKIGTSRFMVADAEKGKPSTNVAVYAARFELTTDRTGATLGRLVYGKSYLERSDAVPFDPVELKLTSRVYETTMMKGVFGALRDASPDSWGRRLIERHLGQAALSEL